MKRKRYKADQVSKILHEYDQGKSSAEIVREYGISKATFYKWRERYAGMDASDLKRLKSLEEENRRLKKMYSELALDHELAKEIIAKKL